MAQQQNSNECAFTCWMIAGLAGLLSMILLFWMADFGALQALFTGALIGFVLGLVLSIFICRKQTAAADLAAEDSKPANLYAAQSAARRTDPAEVHKAGTAVGAAAATPSAATQDAGADATAPAGTTAAVSSSAPKPFVMQKTKELPGQQELAARKGEWKYQNDVVAAPTSPIPGGRPAEPDAAAPAAEPAATPAAATTEAKPELMDAPGAGGKDNLQLIGGVGPKLEQTLNDMGIWHFDQIAKWGSAEIAWVDARIKFKGRIERDDWMSQAKILAEGGETQFSQKKKT